MTNPSPAQARAAAIEAEIVDALEAAGRPLTQPEIVQRLNMDAKRARIWQPLRRLLERRQIVELDQGRYQAAGTDRILRRRHTTISGDCPAHGARFLAIMIDEIDRLKAERAGKARSQRARQAHTKRRAS